MPKTHDPKTSRCHWRWYRLDKLIFIELMMLRRSDSETDNESWTIVESINVKSGVTFGSQSVVRVLPFTSLSNEPGVATQTNEPQVQKQKHNEQQALLIQQDAEYAINTEETPVKAEDSTVLNEINVSKNTQTTQQLAEISDTIEEQASIDRTKYLNSSTKEFTPAEYMRSWINRVERVGNLNYPDHARRKKLSGTLILDVVISADGKLVKTDLRQSSGHQILDDAAKRIVKLAAPYPPFPKKLRNEADVIHITRSWEFLSNSSIRTR